MFSISIEILKESKALEQAWVSRHCKLSALPVGRPNIFVTVYAETNHMSAMSIVHTGLL